LNTDPIRGIYGRTPMNFDKLLKVLAAVTLAALAMYGGTSMGGSPTAKKPAAPKAAPPKPEPRLLELKVTEKGFEPDSVKVKKGEPLKLRVTRVTDQTCATQIIVPDFEVNTELPLDKPVDIEFTPTKAGTLNYGCAMGMMIAGTIVVE
jgi:plastocyanin domain-containing protein